MSKRANSESKDSPPKKKQKTNPDGDNESIQAFLKELKDDYEKEKQKLREVFEAQLKARSVEILALQKQWQQEKDALSKEITQLKKDKTALSQMVKLALEMSLPPAKGQATPSSKSPNQKVVEKQKTKKASKS